MSYVNDPIGDLLTRMRNAQAARSHSCKAPWSRIKQELCELLVREGWIEKVEVLGDVPKQDIEVTFVPGKKLLLKRVSTPGRRMYAGVADIQPVLRGYGNAIITTSQGLMTDKEARKKRVGGEILCTIA
jgi:small subunit ribosomal protein S8